MHSHLRRLDRVWLDAPIYFVTTCTKDRRRILAHHQVCDILIDEWRLAHDRHGWAIGRYVIMPDHVHFFCRAELDAKPLPEFAGAWKSWTSRRIRKLTGRGQIPGRQRRPGFGKQNFLTTFFDLGKVIAKNGIMYGTIPCEQDWSGMRRTGRSPAKSKR